MTNSGFMRGMVRIEQRSTVQDSNGEESPTWSLVGTRFAEKVATPGREVWSSNERHARVPTIFRIRFPKTFSIESKMRLIHKSKLYDIISAIDENGRGVDMLVSCEELVGEPANE